MEIIGSDIKKAVKAIKEGKVLVCPTDTVYGLVCDAANKKAVERIFRIKKRPKNKPIPIFVKDIKMARKVAEISLEQEKFLKEVWPGAVTAILPAKRAPKTVGIRIPKYKLVLGLAKHIGPLAESSANISGKPASTKAKEVLKQFRGKKYQPDLMINVGNLKPSKPSMVIDLTVYPPKVLRY